MTVYRPLRDIDVLQTVLTASPRVSAVSGTTGWRGGPNGTGSISVYGGVRAPGSPLQVQPKVYPSQNDVGVYQPISGSYPLTASIRFVDVLLTREAEDKYNWGSRSWKPIANLYDYYGRYNTSYHTGTYDYQCVFFQKGSRNSIISEDFNNWQQVTGAMTVEAWVKPFSTSSLNYGGLTIVSRQHLYWFGLTGSNGVLTFSSSLGLHTSSLTVPQGEWTHVAFSMLSGTGSLYVGLKNGKDFSYTGSLALLSASYTPFFTVGNKLGFIEDLGSLTGSFHGLIQEVREWSSGKTWTQLSSSHNSRLSNDVTTVNYLRLKEGHLSGSTIGSASDNYAFFNFTNGPSWQPSDNPFFYPDKTYKVEGDGGTAKVAAGIYTRNRFKVLNIPRLFYGRQIATGSLELTCRSFSGANKEMIRVLKDDGRGSLYVSSYLSSSMDDASIRNVPWNRVGNVFYSEGIVVITDDSLFDFGTPNHFSSEPADLLSVSFRGVSRIPTKMVSCRIGPADANGSNNQTFATHVSGTDRYELVDDRTTYVTAVGLYDSERRLVGVAKLADPLRNRERDRLNIRIKFDT